MGERAPKGSRLRVSRVTDGVADLGEIIYLRPDPPIVKNLPLMNRGKVGRPFKYDDGVMTSVAAIKYLTGVSYRASMDVAAVLGGENGDAAPDFTTLCKRLGGTKIILGDEAVIIKRGSETLRLVPDEAGIVPATRGEWIRVLQEVKRGRVGVVLAIQDRLLASRVVAGDDERPVSAIS